jgi:azurin
MSTIYCPTNTSIYMKSSPILLSLALLSVAAVAQAAPNCTITLKAGDNMKYDLKTVSVSAACKSVSIELQHTGKMPAAAMGHNVVITATPDADAVTRDALKAGAAAGYVPAGDKRILVSTKLIGGGQSTTATLAGGILKAGGAYSFFCTFPGHSALMRGTVTVES